MVRSGLACVENHPHQGLISNLGHWCILANAAAQTNMHCLMLEPPWKICTSCGIIISSRKWKIIEIAKQHLWRKSGTIVPKDPWKSLFWYYGRLIHPFCKAKNFVQLLCATHLVECMRQPILLLHHCWHNRSGSMCVCLKQPCLGIDNSWTNPPLDLGVWPTQQVKLLRTSGCCHYEALL